MVYICKELSDLNSKFLKRAATRKYGKGKMKNLNLPIVQEKLTKHKEVIIYNGIVL
jgi:hypothetical protein